MIKLDLTRSKLSDTDFTPALQKRINELHKKIRYQDGLTDNGWVELPNVMDEIVRMNAKGNWVRGNCDVLIVIGIGGSYLGAYAGIQMLKKFGDLPVEFLGTSFDPEPIINVLQKFQDKRVCVNVVSKSGTTMEITAAFNIVDAFLHKKYPNLSDYQSHLIITTDKSKGCMREFAQENGIETFVVPDGVGGRYSVLSAVGLFPFAAAGLDIAEILSGAKMAYNDCALVSNDAYKYAAARYLLHTKYKKDVEVLTAFNENLGGLTAWAQQLFGESEGKDGKGIFVSPMIFTRDLHSMGQYIQQGKPVLFETIINVIQPRADLDFNKSNFLSLPVASYLELNRAAINGTIKAHSDAGVSVIILNIDKCDCANFGYLVYFFETACAMSAYLLNVNPFDQPGVEFYKKNMKQIIGI